MKSLLLAYPSKSHLVSCVSCAIFIKNTHRMWPQSMDWLTHIIVLGKVSSKRDRWKVFLILFLRQGFVYDSHLFLGREIVMEKGNYYKDVREHLEALEERGKLVRIKKRINKDTELMPLVRWQFRGLEESQRKAFFFHNVFDLKGKSYSMPVTVGTLAASTEVYSIGLKCTPEEIHERWTHAQLHPIAPVQVSCGPVQETI